MSDDSLTGQIRRIYGLNSLDVQLPTVSNILVAPRSATKVIVVRYITFSPSTNVPGTLVFKNSLTGETIGTLTIPSVLGAGQDQLRLDYGVRGTALTVGASLVLGTLPAGAAGRLHVESYQKFR